LWREENNYEKFSEDNEDIDLKNLGVRAQPDVEVNTDIDMDAGDLPDIVDPDVDVPDLGAEPGAPEPGGV
jgi:hypothetical protein